MGNHYELIFFLLCYTILSHKPNLFFKTINNKHNTYMAITIHWGLCINHNVTINKIIIN